MSISRLRNASFLLCFLTACIVCAIGVVSTASRLNLDAKSFEKGDALLSVWNIPIESESHRLFLFRLIETSKVEPLMVERIRERKVYRVTFDAMLFYGLMLCAIVLSFYTVLQFREAVVGKAYPFFQEYQTALNFCRAFFALLVVGTVFNLARAYLHLQAEGDLRRLRWTLVGIGIGALPFVLFSIFLPVVFSLANNRPPL